MDNRSNVNKNDAKWSLSRLFKSNRISSTNPAEDIAEITKTPVNPANNSYAMVDATEYVNLQKAISEIRNNEISHNAKYEEYKLMDEEVIVQAALKSYSDDATVVDNSVGSPVWIKSDDPHLADELSLFLESIGVDTKVWGWVYRVAQYGDVYLENVFNSKGYLIGVRDKYHPELMYHIIEDGEPSGYLVRKDPRKASVNRNGNLSEYDLYNEGKYTHMYLKDNAQSDDLLVNVINPNTGNPDTYEFEVARGRSILESVRANYRILRLLEDTIITNKVARSEYTRLYNIEVGEATGMGSDNIVKKFKRLFDSKPRFDSAKGEYSSQRQYRPSADAVFNAVHGGKGAVDIKEIGGNIETQYMTDVEYFRNKMFTGLQIPKAFLGFEDTLPSNPGESTLARLDIRYSRSVRRIQSAIIRGLTELCDLWLGSRGRYNDIGNYEILMYNPSSAEELSRLEELSKRIDIIKQVVSSVAETAGETVNVVQLYSELVNEFIDTPSLRDIFEDLLAKSIIIQQTRLNTISNQTRVESIASYKELSSAVNTAMDPVSADTKLDDASSDVDFGGDSLSDKGPVEFEDSASPIEGMSSSSDTDLGAAPSIRDMSSDTDLGGGADEIPLGSLSNDEPIESASDNTTDELKMDTQSAHAIRKYSDAEKTEIMDNLLRMSVLGPTQYRATAEKLAAELAVNGFDDSTMMSINQYMSEVNKSLAPKTNSVYRKITEALLSNDDSKIKDALSEIDHLMK